MKWQLGLGRENGLAFWGLLFIEGSFAAFFPIWPLYMEELGAPITVVGLLLALGGVFRLFVLLPTARIAERIGSRRLLLISRTVSAFGIASAAFAPSWPWLVPVMIGSAIGSMAFPLILAHVSANAPEGEQVRAFSIIVTIGPSFAFLIAPLLASGLIQVFDLRAPFILSAIFTLISVAFLSRISESAPEEIDGDQEAARPSRGFRAALSNTRVRNLLLLKLFIIFSLGLGTQLIPNYLREVGNYADARISLFSAFSAVGTIAFGALVVRNRRFNDTPLLGAALGVGIVSVGYVLFLVPEVMALVIVAFLFRGGLFATMSLFSAVLSEFTPARDREHVFTLSELAIVGGFSSAPLVAGFLYGFDPSLPLIVSAIAGVPAVAGLLHMSYQRRHDDAEPSEEVISNVAADTDAPAVVENSATAAETPPAK